MREIDIGELKYSRVNRKHSCMDTKIRIWREGGSHRRESNMS